MGNIADVVAIGNGKIATNYLSLTEAQKIKRSIVGARENYDEYGPGILKDIIKDPTVQYILIANIQKDLGGTRYSTLLEYIIENSLDTSKIVVIPGRQVYKLLTPDKSIKTKEELRKHMQQWDTLQPDYVLAGKLLMLTYENMYRLYNNEEEYKYYESEKQRYIDMSNQLTKEYLLNSPDGNLKEHEIIEITKLQRKAKAGVKVEKSCGSASSHLSILPSNGIHSKRIRESETEINIDSFMLKTRILTGKGLAECLEEYTDFNGTKELFEYMYGSGTNKETKKEVVSELIKVNRRVSEVLKSRVTDNKRAFIKYDNILYNMLNELKKKGLLRDRDSGILISYCGSSGISFNIGKNLDLDGALKELLFIMNTTGYANYADMVTLKTTNKKVTKTFDELYSCDSILDTF